MTILPQCFRCVHLADGSPRGQFRCAAFPEGIPTEILLNEFDHRDAYEGDGGIRFEPKRPA